MGSWTKTYFSISQKCYCSCSYQKLVRKLRVVQTKVILFLEINDGKGRIRHTTTLKLKNEFLHRKNRLMIQSRSHYMSDPFLSDIYLKNKMTWVWTTLINNLGFAMKPTLACYEVGHRLYLSFLTKNKHILSPFFSDKNSADKPLLKTRLLVWWWLLHMTSEPKKCFSLYSY